MTIVAGIDFGTASVRAAIVDDQRGVLGHGIGGYPVGRDRRCPEQATQRHADHLSAMEKAIGVALAVAAVHGREVAALAVATTGSSVAFLDKALQPIDDYYLWCDHRAWKEAVEITDAARRSGLEAIEWCGGSYSAEWGFAKLLHWLRHKPELADRYVTAAEHCDIIVATLCGVDHPDQMPRSACAMGHKWMWNPAWGGLPPQHFLSSVDPLLAGVRERLSGNYAASGTVAGTLSRAWAHRLGLRAGIPIPVGALDAHWDAVGAGCRPGDVVNVVGTSSCIMATTREGRPMPGINGVVAGSIHPDQFGIEAGLAAVGELFNAIARRSGTSVELLADALQDHRAGQTGLLRLCWDNGDRSVLADPSRRGMTLGWSLQHSAADELFAAIEGTGFHTRIILERMSECGTTINRVINAGGIPRRNDVLNRVYAAILGKPVLVPEQEGPGLGSAIFAMLAAGAFADVEEAQDALCPSYRAIEPDAREMQRYEELFALFSELYVSPGIAEACRKLTRIATTSRANQR